MSTSTPHWTEERSHEQAPVHLSRESADAWASGWNAAVVAATEAFTSAIRPLLTDPSKSDVRRVLRSRGGA